MTTRLQSQNQMPKLRHVYMPVVNVFFVLFSDSDCGFSGLGGLDFLGRHSGLEEETSLSQTRWLNGISYYCITSINYFHYMNIFITIYFSAFYYMTKRKRKQLKHNCNFNSLKKKTQTYL